MSVEISDHDLVEAFLRDDGQAFRLIYRRHTGMLYALAIRMVGVDDAEDVLQETWLRAAAALRRFGWGSTLRTWLCGIAVNCSRECLRKRSREAGKILDETATAVFEMSASADIRIDLERAVQNLTPRYREAFLLHDVVQLSHAEIASILSINLGTSKSNTARARAAIREMLRIESDKGRP